MSISDDCKSGSSYDSSKKHRCCISLAVGHGFRLRSVLSADRRDRGGTGEADKMRQGRRRAAEEGAGGDGRRSSGMLRWPRSRRPQAVEKKTPFEDYQIDEFLGFVLIQQKKYGEAAPVFERMLNSGFLPPEQVDDRTKAVAQLYFQVKDYQQGGGVGEEVARQAIPATKTWACCWPVVLPARTITRTPPRR